MRRGLWVLVGGLAVATTGCGGPSATPVEGTVAFASGNRTSDNLLLQFHPTTDGGAKLRGGSALSDTGGKFTVTGDDGAAGLPPGTYIVTVVDNNLNVEDEPGTKGAKRPPPNRVPLKYTAADEKLNPLKVTVEKGKAGYELKLD